MLILFATTLVVCAPGYPGSTAEAKPAMDAFAHALAAKASLRPDALSARYEETDAGGVTAAQQADAGLVLATLPFFLAHEDELQLTPRLLAVQRGSDATQAWTLVAGKDAPKSAAALAGYAIQSSAPSPRFVRAMAPALPADAAIASSGAVLSGLRKAANGERLALLLDGAQAQALPKLPFHDQLAAISTSPQVPIAIVATVGRKLDEKARAALEAALVALGSDPAAQEALAGIQMSAFVPLDAPALAAARAAWKSAK